MLPAVTFKFPSIRIDWNSEYFVALRGGNYALVINETLTSDIKTEESISVKEYVSSILRYSCNNEEEHLVVVGVSSLCLFIQTEWTGPELSSDAQSLLDKINAQWPADGVINCLLADTDDFLPCRCPFLLYFALSALDQAFLLFPNSMWAQIWLLRALMIQQQMLDESSQQLYAKMQALLKLLEASVTLKQHVINLRLEAARVHLYYGFVERSQIEIEKAAQEAQLKYNFTGALGKRTHYQENDLAQLIMQVDVQDSIREKIGGRVKTEPKVIPLNDDVRMEQIKLADTENIKEVNLKSQHVAILLAVLMLRRKSMPEDELSVEESRSIVEQMLRHQGGWAVQLSTLLVRSHLERSSRRTVERAMMQVQAVLDDTQNEGPGVAERLQDLFISYLPSRREVETTLAELQLSLGAVKSALEICLRLQHWELAIACYNFLQLRHKAKELIEQELSKCETPKLWCLLGDATDDTGYYQKAWDLSNCKSARAQRHWANYLYTRKKYGESIEHLEKSLDINSLQSDLWFRLGFAALHEEKWELGAKAYRRYCTLEPDSFEAWNNLARCYCESNQTQRAWRALKEALKVDTSNWRVWDNYMRVSAQEKQYTEAIRSYNQILSLKKENHVDMPALVSIVKGYFVEDEVDVRRNLKQPLLDLLARICAKPSKHAAELWILSADIFSMEETAENHSKEWECLLKAHTASVNVSGWDYDIVSCQRVVDILQRIYSHAVKNSELKSLFLLIAKSSVSAISRRHPDNNVCDDIKLKLELLSPTSGLT